MMGGPLPSYGAEREGGDRKSTRLNSSHVATSYAVFCLKKKKTLETAKDWSHDLLTDAERMLLRRLCEFTGRFTPEDLEAARPSECTPSSRPPALPPSLV